MMTKQADIPLYSFLL